MAARVPAGLGARGRALWSQMDKYYKLDPIEQALLVELCRSLDLIEKISAELATMELVVMGSTGQARANPLLGALDQAQRTVDRLAGSLGISMPGLAGGPPRGRGHQAKAARARWARSGVAPVVPIAGSDGA